MDSHSQLDDHEILARAQDDPRAFAVLIERHQAFVFGAAFRVTNHRQLAEDMTQETFLRAYRSAASFRGEGEVRAWLYRIARNLALNAVTRAREVAVERVPDTVASPSSEDAAMRRGRSAAVRAEIQSLPELLRGPLVLREFNGLSYQEISERLDLPINTVRTRLHRARAALGASLESEHV